MSFYVLNKITTLLKSGTKAHIHINYSFTLRTPRTGSILGSYHLLCNSLPLVFAVWNSFQKRMQISICLYYDVYMKEWYKLQHPVLPSPITALNVLGDDCLTLSHMMSSQGYSTPFQIKLFATCLVNRFRDTF